MPAGSRSLPLEPAYPSRDGEAARRSRTAPALEPLPGEIERLDRIATFLDSQFSVLGLRFGFDSILGLVPVIGDAAALGISGYLVAEAARAGARKRTLARMLLNTGLDATLGSVPIIGDAFDFVFKANKRNMALLRREILRRHAEQKAEKPLASGL